MQTRRAVALPALLGYCLACGDSPSQPGSALRLDVVGGNGQSAPINTELPDPLVVRVTDAGGQPVEGQIVNFRVTSGGGSMFAGAGSTNGQGVVQDRWTLGPDAGSQTAEARAVDNVTGAAIVFQTFTATATTPPAPPRLEVVSGGGQAVTVGTQVPQPIVFRAQDGNGAPVPNLTFTLRSISCSESNGVICNSAPAGDQLTNPTLTTGADGKAAFTGWTLPTKREALNCVAAYAGTTQPKNGDDLGLGHVCVGPLPGPPAELVKLSGDNQQVSAGTPLTMGVRVQDQYGNTVGCNIPALVCGDPSEVQVTFTPSTGGQVSQTQVLTDRGTASTDWTLTTGPNTLKVAVGSLSVSYAATGN